MDHQYTIIILASIGLLTIICQWVAWLSKLPAILFLLLVGIIAGPLLGWIKPEAMFGHLLIPIVELAVALILFEGSLTLNFKEIHQVRKVVRNLVSIGLILTALIGILLAHYIIGFSWPTSAVFGTITAISGPTVIGPMIRSIRPNAHIANILRWEGTIIDPIGALLAVVIFDFIAAIYGGYTFWHTLFHFLEMILVGGLLGVVVGYWLGVALRAYRLPEYLHNVATLTIVLATFALSDMIDTGTGLLAVTMMGITLANMDDVPVSELLGFKESLSLLLISGLFIVLAAQIEFAHISEIIVPTLIVLALLQFVVRPLVMSLCTAGSHLHWQERLLLAWIAPRGIVAAAIAALFAIRLEAFGVEDGGLLVLATFIIIIGTVVWQSLTSRWLANRLGVAEPEPKGVLIIGANPTAIAIAKTLQENHFRVQLAAMDWAHVQMARMQGLDCYYGNPTSEHADRHLDLIGIGKILALSSHSSINALVNMRYRSEFGRDAIYSIQTQDDDIDSQGTDKHFVAQRHQGYVLFDEQLTYSKLAELIETGADIRTTLLTKNFDFEDYLQQYHHHIIPLFAIDPKGLLHIFCSNNNNITPAADWKVIGIIVEKQF